jgi:hypothetical protein
VSIAACVPSRNTTAFGPSVITQRDTGQQEKESVAVAANDAAAVVPATASERSSFALILINATGCSAIQTRGGP